MNRTSPRRVLHFFGGMNRGGAETLIMNIYRKINRNKIQFDFAVHTDKPCHYDEEIKSLGGKILRLPSPNQIGFWNYSRSLMKALKDNGPYDCVHSHVHYFSGFILKVAERYGVPIRIAHSHTTHDSQKDSFRRYIYRMYMRHLIIKHATKLIGCSRDACEALFGSNCWNDPRTLVFYNAIDLEPYEDIHHYEKEELRKELGLPLEVPLIGHVGRFHPQKNHPFLIEIFIALLERLPNAHLVLAGDGPLRTEIEKLVKQKGLSTNVSFLGVRKDVPKIMAALDVFLLPSLYEGLGIVLIEAQAAGTYCVTSDVVPKEADLNLGSICFVGFQDINKWVQAILDGLHKKKLNWSQRKKALIALGYDVNEQTINLTNIYSERNNFL